MTVPDQDITACREAHQRLRATVERLGDADLKRPSLLPGWSVAHVLTHLARNADSVVRRLEGAARGELVPQYEGGPEGRAAEIERDVQRPAEVVLSDVLDSSEAVDRALSDFPQDAWGRPILLGTGEERPATHLPVGRWREVEVHHVDLGLDYSPDRWDDAFVQRFLPDVLASLQARAEPRSLLAWGFGRAAPPPLEPWG